MRSESVTPGATDRLRDQHTLTRRPRVWDDRAHGPIAGTLQLPIAGASIHIY